MDRSLKEQLLDKSSAVKTIAQPGPSRPAAPAATDAGKLPMPAADALKQAEKLIKDLFKADYEKTDAASRKALIPKLLQQAGENKADPAAMYVLLHDARDFAVMAGDNAKASEAQKQLLDSFKIDRAASLLDLKKLEPSARVPEAAAALVTLLSMGGDEALAGADYDHAVRFYSRADDLQPLLKDAALKARLKAEYARVQVIKRESVTALAAEKTLATKPDDADANLTAGKFALMLGDFEKCMPLLAKSKETVLSGLAKSEFVPPTVASEQVKLADGWFDRAEKEASVYLKTRMQLRAAKWYTTALPLTTGLAKIKLEDRLKKILPPTNSRNLSGPEKLVLSEPTKQFGPKLSDNSRAALGVERKELLEQAAAETDRQKQANLLIRAAENALKLGNVIAGLNELDNVVSEYEKTNNGNVCGSALTVKGKYFASQQNWDEAEKALGVVSEKYKGNEGDDGCRAAAILTKHFEEVGDFEKAMKYHEAIINCRGTNSDSAARSCMWFADYFVKKNDKAHALIYLNKIVDKHRGAYDWAKKAAEVKIKALEK